MRLLLLLFLCVGCASRAAKPRCSKKPVRTGITQRLEQCVFAKIDQGVKPLEALQICDIIYRGRK